MNKPGQILLLGKDSTALESIKQDLSELGCQVETRLFSAIADVAQSNYHAELIIVDTVPLTEGEFNALFLLAGKFQVQGVPLLGLVAAHPPRLRYRLVDMGFTDYLPVPYDKLDLQMRAKILLGLPREENPANPDRGPGNLEYLQLGLVELLIEPLTAGVGRSAWTFPRNFLEHVSRLLPAEMLLLFQMEHPQRLLLQAMHPSHSLEGNWQVPVSGAVLPKVLQQLGVSQISVADKTDPFIVDLIALFNLHIASLLFLPIRVGPQVRALLVACLGDQKELEETQKILLERLGTVYAMGELILEAGHKPSPAAGKREQTTLEAAFQSLFGALPLGALVVDHQYRILYTNPAAQAILVPSYRHLIGLSLEELFPQSAFRQIDNRWKAPEADPATIVLEYRGSQGELLALEATFSPLRLQNGSRVGWLILLRDVTAQRALELEKQRSERLASMGVMISGIAHEIRNPLAGIKAIAQAFQDELSPENYLHEYVRRIVRQVDRLDEMLRSLFSYARPPKPEPRPCHLDQVLRDALDALREKMKQGKIRVVERVEANLPQAYVDPSQLHQVLMNVLLNSIQAIQEGGEISIQMQPASADLFRFQRKPFFKAITQRPFVEIVVRDNGCGINSEQIEQVFDPFFTTKTFGTGLGLSIVYQLVKANQGFVYLESSEGKGTSCYLLLPAWMPEAQPKEASES
ncbi:MAG: PAS domain-containing sensor histidine kinase [Calditrichaeota bacterium]|nr:MAG: PAS domain-containing sensor histidine kinase [Calditrichota bacterium]